MQTDPADKFPEPSETPAVQRYGDCDRQALRALLGRFGLKLEAVEAGAPIPGSYWGDEEAGLTGCLLWARRDTPVHSILHEACHYICMDEGRRAGLHTDAGGDHAEENAVCYLQVLLADFLPDTDRDRMCIDMDRWGYSFRLGSAARWFEEDAQDARRWLQREGLVEAGGTVAWRLRGA